MSTPLIDDRDLDDAALWEVIDSAAASYTSPTTTTTSRFRKPLALTNTNSRSPPPPNRPQKLHRSSSSCITNTRSYSPVIVKQSNSNWPVNSSREISPYVKGNVSPEIVKERNFNGDNAGSYSRAVVNQNTSNWLVNRSPEVVVKEISPYITENVSPEIVRGRNASNWLVNRSPEIFGKEISPYVTENVSREVVRVRERNFNGGDDDEDVKFRHCLSGRFPTVSLFTDYQDAAMSVLEKSDYTLISGNPYIKKSGWRKIAFYFNVSFEIKDKTIEFDDNRNVQRAEFLVRAHMQGGRFSDGWGSCERREKKFLKPNNDIPSTAETRAKNKACQDLIGIGQYRPGACHSHFPSPR